MRRVRTGLALTAVLLPLFAGTIAALVLSSPAAATTRCGKAVLEDWYDNSRIDRLYDLNCYEEAIDAIPEEIRVYADAEEVITRALQDAVGGKLPPDPTAERGPKDAKSVDQPRVSQVAPPLDTSGASSVPIPLLVLGGMSLALLAAGGLGYLSRRRRALDRPNDDDDLPI